MIIFLGKGYKNPIETIIDLADLEKAETINGYWSPRFSCSNMSYYVQGWTTEGKLVQLHRHLFEEIPEGLVVDHINHEPLDNRRSCNLRIVTQKENLANSRPTGTVRGSRTKRRARTKKFSSIGGVI